MSNPDKKTISITTVLSLVLAVLVLYQLPMFVDAFTLFTLTRNFYELLLGFLFYLLAPIFATGVISLMLILHGGQVGRLIGWFGMVLLLGALLDEAFMLILSAVG